MFPVFYSSGLQQTHHLLPFRSVQRAPLHAVDINHNNDSNYSAPSGCYSLHYEIYKYKELVLCKKKELMKRGVLMRVFFLSYFAVFNVRTNLMLEPFTCF